MIEWLVKDKKKILNKQNISDFFKKVNSIAKD
jgi:hypothetical protein